LQNEGTERSLEVDEARQADTSQSGTFDLFLIVFVNFFFKDKNPVQEWFENLAKNTSSNAQNTMNAIKDWFSQISQNSNTQGSQNLPTMYMGSFQLLKMPMPQFSDVIKGMGNLATAAQAFNKLTGGLPQGLPLVPQG
jgi:hypothetical protein